MYRLTIRKKNYPQVTTFHIFHFRPAANAAIFLDFFSLWKFHGVQYPFVLDYCTIGSAFDEFKVVRDFHFTFIASELLFGYQ